VPAPSVVASSGALLIRDLEFESTSLQQRVACEPDPSAGLAEKPPVHRATALAPDRPGLEDMLPAMPMPCCLYAGDMDPVYPEVEKCSRRMRGATFFSLPALGHCEAYARSELVDCRSADSAPVGSSRTCPSNARLRLTAVLQVLGSVGGSEIVACRAAGLTRSPPTRCGAAIRAAAPF
jgi:hypothetical protein